jgi:hypothetical protein
VVEVPLLLATTGLAEDALVTALDAACRARLLEEEGADYQFVHDVIAEVVEADLGSARRALLHRRVAEALDVRARRRPSNGSPITTPEAAFQTKPRSIWKQRAIMPGASRAQGAAAGHYQDALDGLDGHNIVAGRGWTAALAGDWRAAHADLDRALARSRQADRTWYSSCPLLLLARLSLAEGAEAAAGAAAQEALALTEGTGDLQGMRWAAAALAEVGILQGRADEARARVTPLLDRPGLEECDVTMLLPVLAWIRTGGAQR